MAEPPLADAGGGGGGSGVLGAGVVRLSRSSNNGDGRIVLSYLSPATHTTLSLAPSMTRPGQPITLTATVTSAVGTVSGTVTFYRAGTAIGTAALHNSVATLTVRAGTYGVTRYTAAFPGSTSFQPSASPPIPVTVTAPAPPAGATPATASPYAALANSGPGHATQLAALAGALILTGLALAASGRRRRAADRPPSSDAYR